MAAGAAGDVIMAKLDSQGRPGRIEKQLLAVGGIYVFDGETGCRLVHVEPEGAAKDLEWSEMLAVEAVSEGTAEVVCGGEGLWLEMVAPARVEIALLDEAAPTELRVGGRFKVQARLYDRAGRELAVGKFTVLQWSCTGVLEVANDPSAGEFGLCDTCYGMHTFRAVRAGEGSIEVRLGGVRGQVKVVAGC